MHRHARSWGLTLCLVLGLTGCASPPAGDVELAKATLDKAVAAGADNFAVASMQAARQAKDALDAELKTQEGKWFKSYAKARDLAVTAQAAADKAAADAVAGKNATVAAAAADTGDTQAGPNLFRNGDFSEGPAGWSQHPESNATVSIDATGPNEHAWHVKYRQGNWSVIYQELNLNPDTVYVYELTIKSTAPVVALYWQAETGRFLETDKAYPEWTHLRYVFLTPRWSGQPYHTFFHPVLMKGAGDTWLRNVRLSQFKGRG